MIFFLFNLNRSLSWLILSDIFSIERKLSALILEEIINNNYYRIDNILNQKFSHLFKNYQYYLFPNLCSKNNDFDSNYNKKNFKKFIEDNIEKNDSNIEDFFLKFTFGQICHIYSFLDLNSRKKIAENFLNFETDREICYQLYNIFLLISHVRNLICHNEKIYDINYKKASSKNSMRKEIIILYKRITKKTSKNIRLMQIIDIVSFLNPSKKIKLCELCNDKIENFLEKIPYTFHEEIKIIINYIYFF